MPPQRECPRSAPAEETADLVDDPFKRLGATFAQFADFGAQLQRCLDAQFYRLYIASRGTPRNASQVLASGVLFEDGSVRLCWRRPLGHRARNKYESLDELTADVQGQRRIIQWIDGPPAASETEE